MLFWLLRMPWGSRRGLEKVFRALERSGDHFATSQPLEATFLMSDWPLQMDTNRAFRLLCLSGDGKRSRATPL